MFSCYCIERNLFSIQHDSPLSSDIAVNSVLICRYPWWSINAEVHSDQDQVHMAENMGNMTTLCSPLSPADSKWTGHLMLIKRQRFQRTGGTTKFLFSK